MWASLRLYLKGPSPLSSPAWNGDVTVGVEPATWDPEMKGTWLREEVGEGGRPEKRNHGVP